MARPREFDEAVVVQQAMDVFWRKGYQAATVQDLVGATGVQRGSLYGAFGDKHGLFLVALQAYTAMGLKHFRHLVSRSDDPVDAVRTFVQHLADECSQPDMVERGCMVGNVCTEIAETDPQALEHVQKFVGEMQSAMADALREGQRRGTFASDRDPRAVAIFIQCGMQGLKVLAKSRPGPAAIRAVVDEILRTLD